MEGRGSKGRRKGERERRGEGGRKEGRVRERWREEEARGWREGEGRGEARLQNSIVLCLVGVNIIKRLNIAFITRREKSVSGVGQLKKRREREREREREYR